MGGVKFPGCYTADPIKLVEIIEKDSVTKTPLNDSYEDLLLDFDIFNPFIIRPLPVYKFK